MTINLWSFLLIASASQCLFLIVFFLFKPFRNKIATRLLITLLSVMLFINVGNLWYAARIFLDIPELAGISRGAYLLIGPVVYLYTLSILRPDFKLRAIHSLHLLGYFVGQVMIYSKPRRGTIEDQMDQVEAFLMNGVQASTLTLVRFAFYAAHVIVYFYITRKEVLKHESKTEDNYMISISSRLAWLKKLNWVMIAIILVLTGFFINALITGYYNSDSNYMNTLIYSIFTYMLAFQALTDEKGVAPDFKEKYKPGKKIQADQEELLSKLEQLMGTEKLFKNPEIKVADVASAMGIPPHQLTALLNREKHVTFFELVNEYRVQEFIELANDERYAHLSIMGIAQEAGFKSKSSFNTAFKKIKGTTPSEYLKKQLF